MCVSITNVITDDLCSWLRQQWENEAILIVVQMGFSEEQLSNGI